MIEQPWSGYALSLWANHWLQGGLITLVAAWVMLWRGARWSAATRCWAWLVVLAAVAALPLMVLLPQQAAEPAATASMVDALAPSQDVAMLAPPMPPVARLPGSPTATWPKIIATAVLWLWLAGVAVLLTRLVIGWRLTRRWYRQAKVAPRAQEMLRQLGRQVGLSKVPEVLQHPAVPAPMLVGLRRPWVALPRGWQNIPEQALRHALWHELAHWRRSDPYLALAVRFVCTWCWLHPAVWWIAARMQLEAEQACDDWALNRDRSSPRDYGTSLVSMAEHLHLGHTSAWAVGCLRSHEQLKRRLIYMLRSDSDHSPRCRPWPLVMAASVCAILMASAAWAWPDGRPLQQAMSHLWAATWFADHNKITPEDGLLYAAWQGDVAAVQAALAQGEAVDRVYRRSSPRSALNAAAGHGHLDVVRVLVERGADPSRVVRGDAPAITRATMGGHSAVVSYLLSVGADPNHAVHKDGSPLIAAAARGDSQLVEMLLSAGADPNISVPGDGSPLIAASRRGHLAVVDLLLAAGASPDLAVRSDGSPLIAAAHRGDVALVERLLRSGADPNLAVPGDGSPLLVATDSRHPEAVQLLLDAGAGVDQAVLGDGSGLIRAAAHGDIAMARTLIAAGADVNQTVRGDGNALIKAARRGHLQMVRLLVDSGAEINTHVSADDTPLINAVWSDSVDVVNYLIEQGADVNQRGDYDNDLRSVRMPLNQAADHRIRGILLAAGATE